LPRLSGAKFRLRQDESLVPWTSRDEPCPDSSPCGCDTLTLIALPRTACRPAAEITSTRPYATCCGDPARLPFLRRLPSSPQSRDRAPPRASQPLILRLELPRAVESHRVRNSATPFVSAKRLKLPGWPPVTKTGFWTSKQQKSARQMGVRRKQFDVLAHCRTPLAPRAQAPAGGAPRGGVRRVALKPKRAWRLQRAAAASDFDLLCDKSPGRAPWRHGPRPAQPRSGL
jgi:hypothetical protein